VAFVDHHQGERLVLDAADVAGFVEPPRVTAAPVPEAIDQALARPAAGPPLRERARGARKVSIIVSDSTRSLPSAQLLPPVMRELEAGGVGADGVTVVVATGVHRPATDEEIEVFVGSGWNGRIAVENHTPHDENRLVRVGTTSSDNEIFVNRTVAEADLRIAFGQVEPHEYAGFTGGPKSILAGVSGERSIRHNHSPEMLLHPEARPGVLEGNPIWQDMLEAATLAGLDFIVNVVLTPAGDIAQVAAGELRETHRFAVRRYRELYGSPDLPGAADMVVTTPGAALDLNLYQSVKPIIAAERVVRDGGAVVLSSTCHEGPGGGQFFVAPYWGANSPEEVVARLSNGFRIEMDHALLLCRLQTSRSLQLVTHAPGVDTAVLERMFLHPAGSLQEAHEKARELLRSGGHSGPVRTVIFPLAQKVVGTERA
jgi:nickel-dependent lactate racemase